MNNKQPYHDVAAEVFMRILCDESSPIANRILRIAALTLRRTGIDAMDICRDDLAQRAAGVSAGICAALNVIVE